MTRSPEPDDATLAALVSDLASDLERATRFEVHRGPAYETYPPRQGDREPLAAVVDPAVLQSLRSELREATLVHRVVVPTLSQVSLVLFDDDADFVTTLELVSLRWARYGGWPYDALTVGPVLRELVEALDLPRWADSYRALDLVEPSVAAAQRPSEPGLEHAQPDGASPTLCGIPAAEVELYRHLFRFGRQDCAECSHLIWKFDDAFRRLPTIASPDAASFEAAWRRQWPDNEPIAYELPSSERWVRFHSLPESKRYAENESEYGVVIHRHRAILDELARAAGDAGAEVVVVTCSWSAGATPHPRSAPVAAVSPSAGHWRSVRGDDDPESWTHLFLERFQLGDERLEQLLRIVADDQTAGVLIADPELRWLFHPYDGGADVYPSTTAERDRLRATFSAWLSPYPSGR